jgi:predicted alpha/beta-hydrolase family hydrolase
VADIGEVSGLWQSPAEPLACLVLTHGAGAGNRSLAAIADGLEALGVATLRYQFTYTEKGGKRADSPPVARATVRAAELEAQLRSGTLPLFARGHPSAAG